MKRCAVCRKKLKTVESQSNGFGRVCGSKLTARQKAEIREIVSQGFDARIIGGGVIQVEIEVLDEGKLKPLQFYQEHQKKLESRK